MVSEIKKIAQKSVLLACLATGSAVATALSLFAFEGGGANCSCIDTDCTIIALDCNSCSVFTFDDGCKVIFTQCESYECT